MLGVSSIGLVVAIVFVCGYADGNVVKPLVPNVTQDVKNPDKTVEIPPIPSKEVEPVAPTTVKECAKIGQFCNNHSDCCSYSCLGYMKRCVSGTG
ncbi:uncharacterized protein LOC132902126 [Amyelois transitella]|uniref:uncharacterized protein LOC132902126 n=1 Tax=Amyelois transitella TaxID=680683 RepID=UPI0029904641|nr:uncharacterized protein LOC132902126 [Amyelois transitella]